MRQEGSGKPEKDFGYSSLSEGTGECVSRETRQQGRRQTAEEKLGKQRKPQDVRKGNSSYQGLGPGHWRMRGQGRRQGKGGAVEVGKGAVWLVGAGRARELHLLPQRTQSPPTPRGCGVQWLLFHSDASSRSAWRSSGPHAGPRAHYTHAHAPPTPFCCTDRETRGPKCQL